MNNERPLCNWYKCLNEIPPERKKYCCDEHGVADRKHRQRKLAKARAAIAALKPSDHQLIESVVDRSSYVAALEEIETDGERADRRSDGRLVEVAYPSGFGLRRIPGEQVQNDIQQVFLEEGRRRRRRDSFASQQAQLFGSDSVVTPSAAHEAASRNRRKADAAYRKTLAGGRPPKVFSVDPPTALPVNESKSPNSELPASITEGRDIDAVTVS